MSVLLSLQWLRQSRPRPRTLITDRHEERILLALPDFSYVVVLADRGDYVMLWTAYTVEQMHRREKLRKEYETYKKQLTPP